MGRSSLHTRTVTRGECGLVGVVATRGHLTTGPSQDVGATPQSRFTLSWPHSASCPAVLLRTCGIVLSLSLSFLTPEAAPASVGRACSPDLYSAFFDPLPTSGRATRSLWTPFFPRRKRLYSFSFTQPYYKNQGSDKLRNSIQKKKTHQHLGAPGVP